MRFIILQAAWSLCPWLPAYFKPINTHPTLREGQNGKLYGSWPDPFPPPRNKRERVGYARLGAYVVRTSSLNDKHSCQLFRIAASFSSLGFLSFSDSKANLSCLLATTFSSLRFLFNFTSLQSFESGQALFLLVFYFRVLSSAFLSSVL